MREVGDRCEVNHHRQAKSIRYFYREVHGMVVFAALSALHPVDDTSAFRVGVAGSPDGDACIAGKLLQLRGDVFRSLILVICPAGPTFQTASCTFEVLETANSLSSSAADAATADQYS
jgi:hypothetical protein